MTGKNIIFNHRFTKKPNTYLHKWISFRLSCVFSLPFFCAHGHAEWRADGFAMLATDYIYRGYSLSDGKPTPKLNVTLSDSRSGFFAGLWLAKTDIAGLTDANRSQRRDIEAALSLGHSWSLNNEWRFSGSYNWLEYIRNHQPRDTDYSEYRLGLHYEDSFSLLSSYIDSHWNTGTEVTSLSALQRFVAPFNILGEAELGVVHLNRSYALQYEFLRLSLGYVINAKWSAAIEYSYSGGELRSFLEDDRIGNQLTFNVTHHFSF